MIFISILLITFIISNSVSIKRNLTCEISDVKSWKWVVRILCDVGKAHRPNAPPYCYGAILNKRNILTTASCVFDNYCDKILTNIRSVSYEKPLKAKHFIFPVKETTQLPPSRHPEFLSPFLPQVYEKFAYFKRHDVTGIFTFNDLAIYRLRRNIKLEFSKAEVAGISKIIPNVNSSCRTIYRRFSSSLPEHEIEEPVYLLHETTITNFLPCSKIKELYAPVKDMSVCSKIAISVTKGMHPHYFTINGGPLVCMRNFVGILGSYVNMDSKSFYMIWILLDPYVDGFIAHVVDKPQDRGLTFDNASKISFCLLSMFILQYILI